jgi:two-component system nitrogen regulation sensor histidine kinase NtrY
VIWFITAVVATFCVGFALSWRRAARDHSQMAALLLGLREGDFSLRAATARGPRGAAYAAFNELADMMTGTRRAGIESDALLGKLLGAVELAIVVVGPRETIIGVNQAAEHLLGQSGETLIGAAPASVGIGSWLDTHAPNRFETPLPGGAGPWDVRRLRFRRSGRDHLMLVASDLSRALRDEERRVWRGLIRVLSHETGNSLGPIQAIAESLQATASTNTDVDVAAGLALIERRARSLASFIRGYADLARLPPPVLEPTSVTALVARVVALETRLPVRIKAPLEITVMADATQLEQALINLLRNAVDAALNPPPTEPGVVTTCVRIEGAHSLIEITDNGPGLPPTNNMFVPGFTTKKGGSGIGLVLAREILEAHGGTLLLRSGDNSAGTVAQIRLPLCS